MPIKVLLADDSNMMRDAMRRILESEQQSLDPAFPSKSSNKLQKCLWISVHV
jgi:PleD family two-component response regulator